MATKKNDLSISQNTLIQKIYEIRGTRAMLDSDLAELYGVETKRLNEQIRRNLERFPEDFMFRLTESEWQNLKSQIATSSWGGRRKLPLAFTEHGVLMLSSILNSRQWTIENGELKYEIEEIKRKLNNQDKNMELVFGYLDQLIEKKSEPRKRIGFMPDEL